MDVSCIVLAGGKGKRLGQDKTAVVVGDRSLLELVVSRLSLFNGNIIIVTAGKQNFPQLIGFPGLKIVTDIYPGKGSLGGIYTGLANSDSFYNLAVACDMPFLNRALLRYMLKSSAGYDLVAPRLDGKVEPLHAVYSKGCLVAIDGMLKQNNLTIMDLFKLVRVRYLEAEEIDRFDPNHLSFFNINTEADLRLARELAGRGDSICDKC